jgi:DNA-binding MarR family transcriptional regulator
MADFKSSDSYQITWLVRRLFRSMGQVADNYLQALGISAAERAVLEFLYPDNSLSVPQVAERYRVSRQHVQVTVNALLERGLLLAEQNPRHKRSPLIRLSDEGRSLFFEVTKRDRKAVAQLFGNVSDAEAKRVRATLEKLLDNIS